MKFGKNLQKIVDLSDPSWSPFWPNYKQMKKLLKDIQGEPIDTKINEPPAPDPKHGRNASLSSQNEIDALKNDPGEKLFFKLMHTELQKVDCFFQKAQAEVSIKFEIITEGMSITQGQTTSLVKDKWSTTAKSVFALYRDLLMLEIFCIMSFCAFSKALKKHDKITNHDTRAAFMNRVVSKAKFASYPALSEMIEKCEKIHKEVTDELIATGTQDLLEDERLFIETVRSLNAEAVSVAHEEGATDIRPRPILGASWSQKQQMNGDISPHGQETEDTEKPASKKLKQEN